MHRTIAALFGLIGLLGALGLFSGELAFAATGDTLGTFQELTPIIRGPDDIPVGRTIVLDSSASVGLGEETSYRWYRDAFPQPISRTVEAVYTPEQPGITTIRLVIGTNINGELVEVEAQKTITVYERKIVLIADADITADKIQIQRQTAANAGIYLPVLQLPTSPSPLGTEEALFRLIKENVNLLGGADAIILWTDGIGGLQALMRALEGDEERLQGLRNQTIILISERNLNTLTRTARGPFSVLRPAQILATRRVAINPLLSTKTIEEFVQALDQRDDEYIILNASTTRIRPWNILTSLVNYMLTHGTPSQTVILLLMLPVIATILAFLKQVIGVTTFGLYTPSVIALSFLSLGWHIGLPFLLFILATGYATRSMMRHWRLLYVPKVAIIITSVSITLLVLLGIGTFFNIVLPTDTIFVLLVMSTLSESFLNVKTEEGLRSAMWGIGETILAALLCVFIAQWPWLQSVVLAYPEHVVVTIILANIGLGKWTGLRLVEYFRFREILKHMEEE